MNDRLYLLKLKLLDIEPGIWRRFVVPGSNTLNRLHDVIYIVMGWKDYYLHAFTIGKRLGSMFVPKPNSKLKTPTDDATSAGVCRSIFSDRMSAQPLLFS
jgi:hypothetical protein